MCVCSERENRCALQQLLEETWSCVGDSLSQTIRRCAVHASAMIPYYVIFLIVYAQATIYLPLIKEDHLLTDTLLRELIDQMGNELADTADSYLEYSEKAKELPIELPADYILDTLNPNPSIRDQEYLQHSSLGRHRIQATNSKGLKNYKTDNSLPAYCTPPNPCPVGYTSENNCLINFENTAAFSREYQSAQDCMCDTEHMLECSNDSGNSNSFSNVRISNSNLNQMAEQFQEENPFFQGEKLPIAAKKGTHVID